MMGSNSGEHELGLLVGKLLVDCGECRQLALNVLLVLVLGIKNDLQQLAAIKGDACALANNLSRSHQIFQNGLVHRCQGAAAWSDLQALAPKVLVQDGPVGHKHHMLAVELLLQLSDETALDLLHNLPNTEREVDHHGHASLAHLNILGTRDVDILQLGLDIARRRHLDVKNGLGHFLVQLRGDRALLLHKLLPCVQHDRHQP
mmetsp:Transcript_66635/g.146059  ORF Transcript_66635/g.146059 Transcript_66635/m.146059 type:complete len:203 (-) Transcript_66635:42-650(-)